MIQPFVAGVAAAFVLGVFPQLMRQAFARQQRAAAFPRRLRERQLVQILRVAQVAAEEPGNRLPRGAFPRLRGIAAHDGEQSRRMHRFANGDIGAFVPGVAVDLRPEPDKQRRQHRRLRTLLAFHQQDRRIRRRPCQTLQTI